jgi:aspartyl protease family protein
VSGEPKPSGNTWRTLLIIAVLGGVAALVLWLATAMPGSLDSRDSQIELAYRIVLLVAVVPSLFLFRGYAGRQIVRDAAAWVAIFAVLALGYSFRDELRGVWERVAGEFVPRRGTVAGERTVSFRAANDGHFHLEAFIDGVPVRFMVDTGASDVMLTEKDARRVGLDPARLSFTRTYQTANGQVQGAPVTLGELRIGSIVLRSVRGSVSRNDAGGSLLGMSALGQLSGFSVSNGTLTLRQ